MSASPDGPRTGDSSDNWIAAIGGLPGTDRLLVVGCGARFGNAILPVLKNRALVPAMVIDPDARVRDWLSIVFPDRRSTVLANELDDSILRTVEPSIVIIASPSGLHFDHARLSLTFGGRVFVEKPLARTGRQAHELQVLGDRRIGVSEQRIHRADMIVARRIIDSGQLGTINEITYEDSIARAPSFRESWRNDPRLAGGGILFDLGYHTMNTILWLKAGIDGGTTRERLLGTGEGTPTVVDLINYDMNVEQVAAARFRLGALTVNVHLTFDEKAPKEILTVKGTDGSLHLTRRRGSTPAFALVRYRIGERRGMTRVALDQTHDTQALSAFLDGRLPAESLNRHVQTVELLDRLYEEAT